MKTRIHVNQHNIKANNKDGGDRCCITAKDHKRNRYGNDVHIDGPSRLVYSPDKPLSCGAVLWIETESDVTVYDQNGQEVT